MVDAALPGLNFAAQYRQVTDSALSQTLAAEQAHFDLGLVQPTAVLGCVMHCEAVPQQASQLFAIPLHQRQSRDLQSENGFGFYERLVWCADCQFSKFNLGCIFCLPIPLSEYFRTVRKYWPFFRKAVHHSDESKIAFY